MSSVFINYHGDNSSASLRFGKAGAGEAGHVDDILEEFPSLSSLPALPNVTKISVHGFSHQPLSSFSLNGAEKFAKLTTLHFHEVEQIDDLGALAIFATLENLRLCGLPLNDLTELGRHPSLKHLTVRCDLGSLKGLGNFPCLESLQIQSTADISHLLEYAQGRRCRLAFHGDAGDDESFRWVKFKFPPQD